MPTVLIITNLDYVCIRDSGSSHGL